MPRSHWWILTISSLSLAARDAHAICREVTERGSAPAAIAPDQELLVIKRTGVQVGCEAPEPPGSPDGGGDAGPASRDAGPAPRDAGGPGDGGAPQADAAPADAGSCQPHLADTVTWVVQPRFSVGPDGARFALLLVTPRVPVIETAPADTFEDLARATAPLKIVQEHYVEDPALGYQCSDPKFGGAGCGGTSTSGGTGDWTPPSSGGDGAADAGTLDGYIPVRTVGSYQVVVLSASDGDELGAWLDGAGYVHGPDDIDALRPYLELGWTVTAVRVKSQEAIDTGALEPLSFTFEGDDLRLPLGVASSPTGGHALLKIYVAAEGRYEVPGAGLSFAGWTPDASLTFLTASTLDVDLTRTADQDPSLVRAAIDSPFQDQYTIDREVRIPSSECPSQSDDDERLSLCDCGVGVSGGSQAGTLLLAVACAAFLMRRRRR